MIVLGRSDEMEGMPVFDTLVGERLVLIEEECFVVLVNVELSLVKNNMASVSALAGKFIDELENDLDVLIGSDANVTTLRYSVSGVAGLYGD